MAETDTETIELDERRERVVVVHDVLLAAALHVRHGLAVHVALRGELASKLLQLVEAPSDKERERG